MKLLSLLVIVALVSVSMACSCSSNMCTNIPSDHEYYLTSFCDSEVACGSWSGNCNEYYMADYKRFGCHSGVRCCQGTNCVDLKVIDGGPACWVEDAAGKAIVDASYSTCKHFTGGTSCGYGDHVKVTCNKISGLTFPFDANSDFEEAHLGPCSTDPKEASRLGIKICEGEVDDHWEF
eukprot:TRINITY_DN5390_c0_g1_i1.p1 TRINITY_DN5390_c0_g1~~TRINITY_DN5390_c0_g1_i1.p1  ORF type:complete len:196 (-),score=25.93 TRINITY_DN5390_c0_g1_i1:311-844(-)